MSFLQAKALTRHFRTRSGSIEAVAGLDLNVGRGEFVLMQGPSGSGKTTLLHMLGALLRPSAGRLQIGSEQVTEMSEAQRHRMRARIGFVFQNMHLLPYLDLTENVVLGGMARGLDRNQARQDAADLLQELELKERAHHRPGQLSAGERQRGALARALLGNPQLVLADEPTGNLDPESAERVLAALSRFQSYGGTVIMVSHSEHPALQVTRRLRLERGRWAS